MSSNAPRRSHAAIVHALLCFAALATLGFPGCPDNVTRPGEISPNAPTMSNCWPNDDGRYWTYGTIRRQLVDDPFNFTPSDQRPPTVSLDNVRQLLMDDVVVAPDGISEYPFELRFDGMRTTGSGVTAQNLVESFPLRRPELPGSTAGFEDRLLARIAAARPDLRARIAATRPDLVAGFGRSGVLDRGGLTLSAPYFIHGYAWIKGPSHIGTYGDIDTLLAWKFLESNIHPGFRFEHQLVPALADDVWLKARVERRTSVTVPGGRTVSNAIEVLYLIDYGVGEATDEHGTPLGLFRPFDYGTVIYAPGVGPVRVYERRFAFAGETRTHGAWDLRLDLQSTGVIVPVLHTAAASRH